MVEMDMQVQEDMVHLEEKFNMKVENHMGITLHQLILVLVEEIDLMVLVEEGEE